jgi:hypothetical protein
MTEKLFFAGLVTVALAATSLVNVGAAKADGISVSGVTTAVGASGAPNVGAGQSTVSAGGGGSLLNSNSLTETAPSTANAATRADVSGFTGGASGFTANGLNGFGQSNAAISINPTTAGASASANNNGNGATATGTYFNATQLGQYGNSGAQGGFVTIGKQ